MNDTLQEIQNIQSRTSEKRAELELKKQELEEKREQVKQTLSLAYATGVNVDSQEQELKTVKMELSEVIDQLEVLEHSKQAIRPLIDKIVSELISKVSDLDDKLTASELKVIKLKKEYNDKVRAEREKRAELIQEHNQKINTYQAQLPGLNFKQYQQDRQSRLKDLELIKIS